MSRRALTIPHSGSSLSSRLGVNFHYTNYDWALDQLKAAGFTWIRKDLFWNEVEPSIGAYDWSPYDYLSSSLAARGLKPLWLLCYGNPIYAGNWDAPNTDALRTAFGNYAEAAARHFGSQDAIFEIWNEPDTEMFWLPTYNALDYAALAQSTLPRIRAGNPAARVITGGLSGFNYPYLQDMLAAGGANGFDGLGIHTYWMGGNPFGDPELVFSYLAQWEATKNQNSMGSVPNWMTEFGYRIDTDAGGDQTRYAALMTRMLLSFWAADFKIIIVYDTDDGEFGLLNPANALGYQGIKTLTTIAAGRTLSSFVIPTDNTLLNTLRMQGPSNVVDAMWMRSGQMTVQVPSGSTATDMLGNPLTITSSTLTVYAASGPVYVTHG